MGWKYITPWYICNINFCMCVPHGRWVRLSGSLWWELILLEIERLSALGWKVRVQERWKWPQRVSHPSVPREISQLSIDAGWRGGSPSSSISVRHLMRDGRMELLHLLYSQARGEEVRLLPCGGGDVCSLHHLHSVFPGLKGGKLKKKVVFFQKFKS